MNKAYALAGLLLLMLLVTVTMAFNGDWLTTIKQFFLQQDQHTALFVVVLALLPLLGFPMSAFCILAGAKFGLANGLALIAVAMWFQLSLCYWLVHSYFAPQLIRLLDRYRIKRPDPNSKQAYYYALAVVALPVLPYMVKNLLVAAGGFRYVPYLLITWIIQMLYSLPFITVTEAVSQSNTQYLWFSALAFAIALALGWWGRRVTRVDRASLESEPG